MKPSKSLKYDLVLVMPLGPACRPAYVIDSLNSFLDYSRCSYKIILADDSQKGAGRHVQNFLKDVDVIETGAVTGSHYRTLCMAYRHALKHYRFGMLLRINADALIIGPDPEAEAGMLFGMHPEIGMAGQYPCDYQAPPGEMSWPREQLMYYISMRHPWHKTAGRICLWLLYRLAMARGYSTGKNVYGGAYFLSYACLRKLNRRGLLPLKPLGTLDLKEDQLFSLLVRAIGLGLDNLASGRPSLIRSARYFNGMPENDVRQYFSERRSHRELNRPTVR